MTQAVKPIPEGVHSITPHLVCDGAIEFCMGPSWSVATQVRDLSPQQTEATMHAEFGTPGTGA